MTQKEEKEDTKELHRRLNKKEAEVNSGERQRKIKEILGLNINKAKKIILLKAEIIKAEVALEAEYDYSDKLQKRLGDGDLHFCSQHPCVRLEFAWRGDINHYIEAIEKLDPKVKIKRAWL